MPKLRYQPPERLPGATHFSARPELCGSQNLVRLLKSEPWVWDDLREACAGLESRHARKRMKGHWELAAVAFVVSGYVDVQPWWLNTTEELWQECGFKGRPSESTVRRRLHELVKVGSEFRKATGVLIRRYREHDPRVMAHAHVDSTEDETHAALVHDCQPGESCQRRAKKARSGRQRSRSGSALRARRAATSEAREEREKWNEQDPDVSVKQAKKSAPEKSYVVTTREGRKYRRIRLSDGCWYATRDLDAGVRAYVTSGGRVIKAWNGYYSCKATCHFTSGVIPLVDAADKQEYDLFPILFDRVRDMVGAAPETVVGDKGFSVASCFEHAMKNGTAPIFPWRSGNGQTRQDKETHDRHGIMRCKHCGGPTEQVRFSPNNGKPRLWFRCEDGHQTPECAKEQTIYCETDPRVLIPLTRLEPLYHELKASHQTYEAVHDWFRDRYGVGADCLALRPKAVGLEWHQLRADLACFVDWLRIGAMRDWLRPVVVTTDALSRATRRAAKKARKAGERRFQNTGERIATEFADMRIRMGLAEPYGPQAAKLGIGVATPPSDRYRSKRKNQLALDLPGP
jgi:hypothetical protein